MDNLDVIVVGGGPAGFFAAIKYAELCNENGFKPNVAIIERSDKILSKVLVSGGGRCNVTHECFDPQELVTYYPRGGNALRGAFSKFQPKDTIAWFKRRGVELKAEKDGRMFPITNHSKTIVDCLMRAAEEAGVKLLRRHSLQSIRSNAATPERISVSIYDQENDQVINTTARSVLFATGSSESIHRLLREIGVSVEPSIPSLFTFVVDDDRLKEIPGLSVAQCSATFIDTASTIPVKTQKGPILVTHWGLSGPAILRLSAWGAKRLAQNKYQDEVVINWLYPKNADEVSVVLTGLRNDPNFGKKTVVANPAFSQIATRMWRKFVIASDLSPDKKWAEMSNKEIRKLAEQLVSARFVISGKGVYKDEFVTCGGVSVDQVNFKDMQSRQIPGIFFAGEVLDIDGVTGGFNFQNAWTTGWLAGVGMFEREKGG